LTSKSIPNLPTPDQRAYYQDLFDSLGDAYWEASDINRKDQVKAAQDEAYDILTQLNQADLATNTAAFAALCAKVKITNVALKKIKDEITQITQNISTGASVISAITKVLSLAPMFP